jgi:CheY-like chemotaxis protein
MSRAGSPLCALVVDDDPQLRELFVRWLHRAGLLAHAARDGQDALRYLLYTDHRPCVMLVDADMPNVDGFALRKLLLLEEDLARVPYVMMSGSAPEWIARARNLGAAACLQKPFGRTELLAQISRYFTPAEAPPVSPL